MNWLISLVFLLGGAIALAAAAGIFRPSKPQDRSLVISLAVFCLICAVMIGAYDQIVPTSLEGLGFKLNTQLKQQVKSAQDASADLSRLSAQLDQQTKSTHSRIEALQGQLKQSKADADALIKQIRSAQSNLTTDVRRLAPRRLTPNRQAELTKRIKPLLGSINEIKLCIGLNDPHDTEKLDLFNDIEKSFLIAGWTYGSCRIPDDNSCQGYNRGVLIYTSDTTNQLVQHLREAFTAVGLQNTASQIFPDCMAEDVKAGLQMAIVVEQRPEVSVSVR